MNTNGAAGLFAAETTTIDRWSLQLYTSHGVFPNVFIYRTNVARKGRAFFGNCGAR